jgi:two-component system LytT family response regulator
MPEVDGFEVIEQVGPARMPPVVFVTAFDRFAVKAFEVHAVDYLLKPFDDARFSAALERAKQMVRVGGIGALERQLVALLADRAVAAAGLAVADGPWLSRIVVKKPGGSILVPVTDIDWIESADYCVKIHTKGRTHVVREAMHRLEKRLDPGRFFRAHRSGIVNLDRIREIQPAFHGDLLLLLHDGSQVKLSRSRRAALEQRLGQTL